MKRVFVGTVVFTAVILVVSIGVSGTRLAPNDHQATAITADTPQASLPAQLAMTEPIEVLIDTTKAIETDNTAQIAQRGLGVNTGVCCVKPMTSAQNEAIYRDTSIATRIGNTTTEATALCVLPTSGLIDHQYAQSGKTFIGAVSIRTLPTYIG